MSSTVEDGRADVNAPPPPTVESLVARVAGGDRDAMEGLYGELGGAVFGLARRMLRDPALAEQVTRDVFVEIWRRAPVRHEPEAVRPWVSAIVRDSCATAIRARAGSPRSRPTAPIRSARSRPAT